MLWTSARALLALVTCTTPAFRALSLNLAHGIRCKLPSDHASSKLFADHFTAKAVAS